MFYVAVFWESTAICISLWYLLGESLKAKRMRDSFSFSGNRSQSPYSPSTFHKDLERRADTLSLAMHNAHPLYVIAMLVYQTGFFSGQADGGV